MVRDAALGKRRVDKLIKVQLLDGSQGWLLIHVEVQHRPDQNLPLRLYQYHRRLNDYHGENVLTLAILADGDPDWRPDHYERQVFGCRGGSELGLYRSRELPRVCSDKLTRP